MNNIISGMVIIRIRKYKKIWSLPIAVLIIVLMVYEAVYYFNYAKNDFSLKSYLENPQKYGDRKAENFGRIVNISQDYFYFNLSSDTIKVIGTGIKRPVLGETVLYLDYRKDGKIIMLDYHNYNYNYILYAVSVLAIVIFIFLFFKEWKITEWEFKNA